MNRQKENLLFGIIILIAIFLVISIWFNINYFSLYQYFSYSLNKPKPIKTYVICCLLYSDTKENPIEVKANWNNIPITFPAVFFVGTHIDKDEIAHIPGVFEYISTNNVKIYRHKVETELNSPNPVKIIAGSFVRRHISGVNSSKPKYVVYEVYFVANQHEKMAIPSLTSDEILKLIKSENIIDATREK